jgi:hypothetical protein
MGMTAGSATISVASDGTITYGGTGMAAVLAPALMNPAKAAFPTPLTSNAIAALQAEASFFQAQANALASALVSYITGNAVVPAGSLLDSGGHACTGTTTVT